MGRHDATPVRACQHPAYHFPIEAPSRQEAGLLAALCRIGRQGAELAAPHLAGALALPWTCRPATASATSLGIQPLGLQFLADAHRAELGAAPVKHRLDHALVVDEALGLQVIQNPAELAGLFLMRRELALQLAARMLAAAEQAQGPPLEGELAWPRYFDFAAGASASASTSAGSSGMPSDSRTLFSISRASSGFSRRNSRALSRPWPIFSPL